MDLSGVDWNGAAPFRSPIHIEGVVRNMAGALLLRCVLSSVLQLSCDRCWKEFSREKSVEFETLLSDELENGVVNFYAHYVLADIDPDTGVETGFAALPLLLCAGTAAIACKHKKKEEDE